MTLSTGLLEATFLPGLGMLGTSLRHRGDELLALPGGLEGYRAGDVTGLPLLAPWANRLGTRRYRAAGVDVDLEGAALHTEEDGLPIHGTMTAQTGSQVVSVGERALTSRFDFGARPDLLASFPFPHELRIHVVVEGATLNVATSVTPTTDRPVPVTFGYHPHFRLPDTRRDDVRLRLPARRRLELDDGQLPTGATRPETEEDEPIGDRTFDDCYELDGVRPGAGADGRRPPSRPPARRGLPPCAGLRLPGPGFVCLEPMTAPVNALIDGGYSLVAPGDSYTARFTVRLVDRR